MPKKIVGFTKRIIKFWFILLIIVILIVAIYNQIAAIIITIIGIAILTLSYLPGLFLKIRVTKLMKQYYRIDDITIAKYFKKELRVVQNHMYKLSQKQENKDWLIIFLEKHYIFYHSETVVKFIELYNEGYGDKEILEGLKDYELKTRPEIKAIMDTLRKHNRLNERKISVKERREKERFEKL